MLASDAVESKIILPCGLQPKVDGVRSLTALGPLTGRSLKQHRNAYVNRFFNRPEYEFLDGEMAAQDERHPELCRLTGSALSRKDGEPFVLWHVFDYLHPDVVGRPYIHRYEMLKAHIADMQSRGLAGHLRLMPMVICNTLEEVLYWDAKWLAEGYEGSIKRDLNGAHKQGRSTVREGGLLRIKRFLDFEFRITGVTEGEANENEATLNELGQTNRSTHQENMVPNGLVGTLQGVVIADVCDPQTGAVLLRKDQEVTVAAGRMSHDDRRMYFEDQGSIIGQIGKAKFFPKGIKDKPRFPTFQCLRFDEDMSD